MTTQKNNPSTETLTADLLEKRDVIARLLAKARLDDAEAKYRIGVEVASVMNDPKRYGKRGVAQIAEAVTSTAALLYTYAKVAATWDEAAFGALVDRRDSKGQPLSFSHLIELAAVINADERAGLVEQALGDALSVRDLARRCRATRTRSGGRSSVTATVLSAVTRSTTSAIERALRDLESLEKLAAAGPTHTESVETVRLLMENCRSAKERFTDLEEVAKRLLGERAQEVAE